MGEPGKLYHTLTFCPRHVQSIDRQNDKNRPKAVLVEAAGKSNRYGAPVAVTHTVSVGLIVEFVVNVTVADFAPAVVGVNVNWKFAVPFAATFDTVVGLIVNSAAFAPEIATLVMFSG